MTASLAMFPAKRQRVALPSAINLRAPFGIASGGAICAYDGQGKCAVEHRENIAIEGLARNSLTESRTLREQSACPSYPIITRSPLN
jgi:hypothetical protein